MQFALTLQTIWLADTSLEIFVPDEEAVRRAYQKGEIDFPYWSKLWPAANALASYLVHHPAYTKDKTVIELGAGLGLPSLVVAKNAFSVLCTDYSQVAVDIAEKSARHHGFKNFKTAVIDWTELATRPKADVLLLSDVNYEPAVFSALQKLIRDYLDDGTTILLSTPQRLMAKDFIRQLLPFTVETEQVEISQKEEKVPISVFVLKKQ